MKPWLRFCGKRLRRKGLPSGLVYGDRCGRVCGRSLPPRIPIGISDKWIAKSPGDSRMELFELLSLVVGVFEDLRIPYIVTGSVASMAYGEPRLTNGIGLVAGLGPSHVAAFVNAFSPREFYLSEAVVRDAIARRAQFNIIHLGSGLKVDVMIQKDTPFDRSRFSRARTIRPVDTYEARFASPEDVILKKMEYYREGG